MTKGECVKLPRWIALHLQIPWVLAITGTSTWEYQVTDEYGDTVLYIFRDERVDSCIGIPRPYVTRYSSNFYLPAALFSVLFESHAIVRCNSNVSRNT